MPLVADLNVELQDACAYPGSSCSKCSAEQHNTTPNSRAIANVIYYDSGAIRSQEG